MIEKNKTYTATDLENYHKGEMSAPEMHALEKAALEDPFLSDALEGYMYTTAAESDIRELKGRLNQKREKKNVFLFSALAEKGWWRIAAFIIIIAGVGYVSYLLNGVKKDNKVAKNDITLSVENKPGSAPGKSDTSVVTANDAAKDRQVSAVKEKESTSSQRSKPQVKNEEVARMKREKENKMPHSTSSPNKPGFADNSNNQEIKNENESATRYVLKGKVTDKKGNAIPFANITDQSLNELTVADTAGGFLLQSKDSDISAVASAPGYRSKSFLLRQGTQPTIEINRNSDELDEVAVMATGRNKSKKTGDPKNNVGGKALGVQTAPGMQEANIDQNKFREYLKMNTAPVYDENGDRSEGDVSLSFLIDKNGRPKNIKVVKSSCKICEEEAIRLVKNGPKWNGKEDETETVSIHF